MWDGTGGRYDQSALRELVEAERGRADRAAKVALRHEILMETAVETMRPFHRRMARLHRATEGRHRAAAELHAGYAAAVDDWAAGRADVPPAFLTAVAENAGVRSLAVTLFGGPGTAAVVVSDPVAARANDLECVFGEGPSLATSGEPGVCGEGELSSRWPRFGPAARELGVRAVVSARLGLGETPLGTLTAYRSEPEPDAGIARSTELVAEALTATALHPDTRLDAEDGLPVHPLFGDLDLEAVVHQATGMLMTNQDCDASDALALIRARAYAQDESVMETARKIVNRAPPFS
ncbi:ANTAR domain-containing protein [Amycolatopsis keratiniphila]|uniref:Transcription antitermination regulator n=1 Tax=Amycolatopsis keratiniphila subsp. keratiniphila TaxID=227715 RepID=A0A1W2M423_9PSEU|nr:ANTAR domain-containing protein [Amycolatopsis keratiniphila]OLZ60333.1 transcription antitermination regulator [Amycolatopsis keratiniphila subsp. nogabecina]ONF74903.1 transcription antitermination regulator [Amycolatopsis keratiniphila subsp. keratiniphila]SDU58936.1 ANTAR domain-containing protein [Amycolatopsis keratiniphila]